MLNLRDVVRHLPALQKALVGSKSELLRIIGNVRYGILACLQCVMSVIDALRRTLGKS